MRIILSHGKVNIFNLAKNAGTSVEQIELLCQAPPAFSRDWQRTYRALGSKVVTQEFGSDPI